jgi:hypothetical protein
MTIRLKELNLSMLICVVCIILSSCTTGKEKFLKDLSKFVAKAEKEGKFYSEEEWEENTLNLNLKFREDFDKYMVEFTDADFHKVELLLSRYEQAKSKYLVTFEELKDMRDLKVKSRLINIRRAQIEYRNLYGAYTASFDTLIDFINNVKLPFVVKKGMLTDVQLKAGLTETKAMEIIKRGNKEEIKKNGLENFSRDTIFIAVKDTIFGYNINVEEIRYVPDLENKIEFEMAKGELKQSSGYIYQVFEVKTPYEVYLNGLNPKKIEALRSRDIIKKKYPGLKIGSLTEYNNNAGNWEE